MDDLFHAVGILLEELNRRFRAGVIDTAVYTYENMALYAIRTRCPTSV